MRVYMTVSLINFNDQFDRYTRKTSDEVRPRRLQDVRICVEWKKAAMCSASYAVLLLQSDEWLSIQTSFKYIEVRPPLFFLICANYCCKRDRTLQKAANRRTSMKDDRRGSNTRKSFPPSHLGKTLRIIISPTGRKIAKRATHTALAWSERVCSSPSSESV